MMRIYITGILCALACVSAAHADDKEKTLYAAVTPEHQRWQQTGTSMSSHDYERSIDNNLEIVKRALGTYSGRLLDRAGSYGPAIGVLGAAVAVAATDTRYNLNDSKTIGMVFRDSASSERSVLFEYRKAW